MWNKKEYMREYMKNWRLTPRGKESSNISYKKRHKRGHAFLVKLKSLPCVDCGIKYPPYVMDFDHVRGEKRFEIGESRTTHPNSLQLEVDKCEVVCSNCHRERTFSRLKEKENGQE